MEFTIERRKNHKKDHKGRKIHPEKEFVFNPTCRNRFKPKAQACVKAIYSKWEETKDDSILGKFSKAINLFQHQSWWCKIKHPECCIWETLGIQQ